MEHNNTGVGIAMALAMIIVNIVQHEWIDVVFFSILLIGLIILIWLSRR